MLRSLALMLELRGLRKLRELKKLKELGDMIGF